MRGFGAAAVFASAVAAGIIASSSGSATAAPVPFSTVRRERCLRVMYMLASSLLARLGHRTRIGDQRAILLRGRAVGQECRAGHDAHDQRREPVVISCCVTLQA